MSAEPKVLEAEALSMALRGLALRAGKVEREFVQRVVLGRVSGDQEGTSG